MDRKSSVCLSGWCCLWFICSPRKTVQTGLPTCHQLWKEPDRYKAHPEFTQCSGARACHKMPGMKLISMRVKKVSVSPGIDRREVTPFKHNLLQIWGPLASSFRWFSLQLWKKCHERFCNNVVYWKSSAGNGASFEDLSFFHKDEINPGAWFGKEIIFLDLFMDDADVPLSHQVSDLLHQKNFNFIYFSLLFTVKWQLQSTSQDSFTIYLKGGMD